MKFKFRKNPKDINHIIIKLALFVEYPFPLLISSFFINYIKNRYSSPATENISSILLSTIILSKLSIRVVASKFWQTHSMYSSPAKFYYVPVLQLFASHISSCCKLTHFGIEIVIFSAFKPRRVAFVLLDELKKCLIGELRFIFDS